MEANSAISFANVSIAVHVRGDVSIAVHVRRDEIVTLVAP